MQYHISTGLIIEKFTGNCGCPLCEIQKIVEEQFVNDFLNDAVMEENTRLTVNEKGFCSEHFDKMLRRPNKLSLAIQISSRIAAQRKIFNSPKTIISAKNAANKIAKSSKTCVICDLLDESMKKYYKTIAQMYRHEPDFYKTLLNIDGFCVKHYAELVRYSEFAGKYAKDYRELLSKIQLCAIDRTIVDLQNFCFAHDHRNAGKPLGSAENALPEARSLIYGKNND